MLKPENQVDKNRFEKLKEAEQERGREEEREHEPARGDRGADDERGEAPRGRAVGARHFP